MKSVFGRIVLLSLIALMGASTALSQNFALIPEIAGQYFDQNGNPLANGFIVTCVAGTSCAYPVPGNPLSTFTDSSGFTSNPDPVPLDASGRASIWLTVGVAYKFVIVASTGVVLRTVDNVIAAPTSGGSSTQYWAVSGTTLSNLNGSGAGDVALGGGLSVTNDLQLNGSLKLRDTQPSPHYSLIRGSVTIPSDTTWRWPATDAAGCLSSDGTGNLSFVTCGGGGGGGSPGGNVSDVQFNNTTFGGSDNFQWNNGAQRVLIQGVTGTPGIVSLTSWIQADQGFLAANNASPGTLLAYNIIQAPTGGVYANSLRAVKYVQVGSNSGTPTLTTSDTFVTGALYFDTGTHTLKVFNDSSAWVSLATGGATSPGGSDTNVQFNSAGSFGGSANMTFTAQRLTVIGSSSGLPAIYGATGYIQADAGFLASPGSATRYNSIQAPGGGMAANSFTATTYTQVGNSAGPFSTTPPLPTSTDTFHAGALSYDLSSGTLDVFNGTTWAAIGGGGGGTPGGPTTSVQFNNSGSFLGSTNFTWNNASRFATISAAASNPGLVVLNGYAQADVGFLAAVNGSPGTALQYNSIQSPTGGLFGKSLKATNYTQTGNSSGIPSVTGGDTFAAGAMYWDTALGAQRVFNGATWSSLASGGVTSMNALTGALSITGGGVGPVTVTVGGSTIALSLPQNIGPLSNVNFGSVASSGAFTSTVTGASTAFNAGTAFSVTGAGNVNVTNLQVIGGAGNGINVTVNTAANTIQSVGGANLCSGGACTGGVAMQIAGSTVATASGYWTGLLNTPVGGSSSNLWIGTAGNIYVRPITTTTGVSCGGVQDGWMAVSTGDPYIVVCLAGVRYRANLSTY